MGGERSSTTRQRLAGEICCSCKKFLGKPGRHGERACSTCLSARAPRHRIYMSYMLTKGWYCQFLEEDLKTPLPRKLTLSSPDKLMEMAERGGGLPNLEASNMLRLGMEVGRGGLWLSLTEEQYQKLRHK